MCFVCHLIQLCIWEHLIIASQCPEIIVIFTGFVFINICIFDAGLRVPMCKRKLG